MPTPVQAQVAARGARVAPDPRHPDGGPLPSGLAMLWPGRLTFDDILRAADDIGDDDPGAALSRLSAVLIEEMSPGAELAQWLATADPGELSDFALPGVAAACHRLAAWAQARELAAVAEMAARAAVRDTSVPVGPDGAPARVPGDAADEVALALTMSRLAASCWTDLAVTLSWRLPATAAALRAGDLDLSRARLIAEATGVLDDEDARAVQDKVLPSAGRQTLGQLRATLRRAVISVDPAAAERRRAESERKAKVGLYSDEEGTATLAGHNLPGVQSAAAMARVTALARAMKAAGAGGGIDLLRAKAYLGLLLGTLPLIPPAEDPGPGPDQPGDPCDDSPPVSDDSPVSDDEPDEPDDDEPGESDDAWDGPAVGRRHFAARDGIVWGDPPVEAGVPTSGAGEPTSGAEGACNRARGEGPPGDRPPDGGRSSRSRRADDGPPGAGSAWDPPWPALPAPGDLPAPGCGPPWPSTETGPSRRAQPTGKVRLTVTWPTLAGLSGEPGSVCWLGPITPQAARALAAAALRDGSCRWRVVLADAGGRAVAVTRPQIPPAGPAAPEATRDGRPDGLISEVTVIVPERFAVSATTTWPDVTGGAAPVHGGAAAGAATDTLSGLLAATLGAARAALAKHQAATGATSGLTDGAPHSACANAADTADSGADRAANGEPPPCDHRSASPAYRPPRQMRELIEARDQTCRFPGCRQPAWRADLDHTIAFDQGGRTCPCNLGPLCRTHHQLKQSVHWVLRQPRAGAFVWTAPSGRRYVSSPALLEDPQE